MSVERQAVATSLRAGLRVEVATRFTGTWTRGFEVVGLDRRGCRVRRISDGSVLPANFHFLEVRPDDRQKGGQ